MAEKEGTDNNIDCITMDEYVNDDIINIEEDRQNKYKDDKPTDKIPTSRHNTPPHLLQRL